MVTVASAISATNAWGEESLFRRGPEPSFFLLSQTNGLTSPVAEPSVTFPELDLSTNPSTTQETLPAPALDRESSQLLGSSEVPFQPNGELNLSGSIFVGYDAWRGTPDGGWENNGIHAGANYGARLGPLSDWTGIGMQLGGSMGVYNWSGTDYRMSHQDEAQPQGFLTYGFFRKASEDSSWSASVVHDWMFNSNYSVFAENPTLSQWRAQLGYAVSDINEFGVWGTWRLNDDTRTVNFFGPVTWRPIAQLNPYWRYKWGNWGPETWLWIGVPERDRLAGNGSLGDYLVGAAANCPLGERVGLYTLVSYMHPSATPGPAAAREDAWNFTIGLAFYPARNARTNTLRSQNWSPLLPVANNGYFLVDASHNY
jgi:hypothetical protein